MENRDVAWHSRREIIVPILVGIIASILPMVVPMKWGSMLVCCLILAGCIVWLIIILGVSSKPLRNVILVAVIILLSFGVFYLVREQWIKDYGPPVKEETSHPVMEQPKQPEQEKPTTRKIETEIAKKQPEKLNLENKIVSNKKMKEEKDKLSEPPNLQTLFGRDFSKYLKRVKEGGIKFEDGTILKIGVQEYIDLEAQTKFLGFYIPFSDKAYAACKLLSDFYENIMGDFDSSMEVWGRGHITDSAKTSSQELIFSKRIYIYHENDFSLQELAALESLYQSKGLSVVFRGHAYLFSVWQNEKVHKPE